jgi:predicted ATPase/DNA-binding winged helix-turn-helix (wHTH) protein
MNDLNGNSGKDRISFGRFRVSPSQRTLERDGVEVEIGSRALAILLVLLEQPGEVLSNKKLLERTWPNVVVDESNLRVHVARLRRVLGDSGGSARYIMNVPGRGYCFVGLLGTVPKQENLRIGELMPTMGQVDDNSGRLPPNLKSIVGRDDDVKAISAEVMSRRFVSIIGPGGMGKSTVAIAAGYELRERFSHDVYFIDLANVKEAALVASTIASTIGISKRGQKPILGTLEFLRGKHALIIFDNCEHVVEPIAAIAEQIFKHAHSSYIIATSREALRVSGEYVFPLRALPGPAIGVMLRATEAREFPAIQLLIERAAASGNSLDLRDSDVPALAMICNRLDGIALALELVAGRIGIFGITGIQCLLSTRHWLKWSGRRTPPQRHQTLFALIDWSYGLLGEFEQKVLRSVSVVVGAFNLDVAVAVSEEECGHGHQIIDAIANLASKSLISVTVGDDGQVRYRLFETTRAYAEERLRECGERDIVSRRHAQYLARVLTPIGHTGLAVETVGDYGESASDLANVRAALEWSFGDHGDAELGCQLASQSVGLLLRLSLLKECYRWCEQALSAMVEGSLSPYSEMVLQSALAISAMFTRGNDEGVKVAIERALTLARSLDDLEHQLELLGGMNVFLKRIGDFPAALVTAEQSATIARKLAKSCYLAIADWSLGITYHLMGNQELAHRYCEVGFGRHTLYPELRSVFGYSHRIRARAVLARTQWLRGFPEQARETARQANEEAAALNDPINTCISMIYTTPVFLWCGDWPAAAESIERLTDHAERHMLRPFQMVGIGLSGELLIRTGKTLPGEAMLRRALAGARQNRHNLQTTGFGAALAESLAAMGHFEDALEAIDAALQRAESIGGTFDMPELLRIKGCVLLEIPNVEEEVAAGFLYRSLELARNQSALGWELRTAGSIALKLSASHNRTNAKNLLKRVFMRFTEGWDTRDLGEAAELLATLG